MLLEGELYQAFAVSKKIGNYSLQKLNVHHLKLSLFLINMGQLVAEEAGIVPWQQDHAGQEVFAWCSSLLFTWTALQSDNEIICSI